ncbi:kremen protein 1-like [Ptychodera flava]|uniref:kremen protein 1-like n=1 Tax=Ptychodera flava TaxID=63121 RepID=UPI00396A210A
MGQSLFIVRFALIIAFKLLLASFSQQDPGFLGRYKESYDRIFPMTTSWPIPQNDVTIQGCIGACRDRGKTVAALISADECYCGDDSVDYWRYGEAIPGLPILPDIQAVRYNTKQCSGDTGTSPYRQGCGGDWQFDVHNTSFGACGGDYTDSSGYIYSPNFPGNYTNEQSCTWTITVDPGHIVKLTTLMLRLQDNDMVIVKDGIEDHSSTISTFTGYSLPQPLYSSSNTLRIEMITDDLGNDLGFILQYEAVNPMITTLTPLVTSRVQATEINTRQTASHTTTQKEITTQKETSTQPKQPNLMTSHGHISTTLLTKGTTTVMKTEYCCSCRESAQSCDGSKQIASKSYAYQCLRLFKPCPLPLRL